ncbi:MAG: GDSL-type esterase/lipase family protein [bacterium]
MRLTLAIVLLELAVAALLLWGAGSFLYRASISLGLVRAAKPFELGGTNYAKTLLVLGDSTGVGVGAARPEETVAGLLGKGIGATYVENHAVSGAVSKDLKKQMAQTKLGRYDAILLQIGANDIIAWRSAPDTAATLAPLLEELSKRGGRVYWMSAGNVGGATIFPFFLRPFYTALNLKYHSAFAALAQEKGITYVNLYTPPAKDPFAKHPEIYLAKDGLHPSSAGYALFYQRLKESAGIQ